MPLLKTSGLEKRFNGFTAVDGVNITVEPLEIHAVIGPNGAGKTTLFNLLSGEYVPTAGKITFDGGDITGDPPQTRPAMGMSRSFQITNVYDNLTVAENIETAVGIHELNHYDMIRPLDSREDVAEQAVDLLKMVGLANAADTSAGSLSHGDKRRLEIGMALASNPELLLLDEPMAGMGAEETREMSTLIRSLSDEMAIMLVEHDIDVVLNISDRITVLDSGSVLAQGEPETIQRDDEVRRVYLEGSHA